ncbi:MAG TPA: phosphotransferase [Nocardioides sp.]|nr:phosphotransferase [Nocardioides sp.]
MSTWTSAHWASEEFRAELRDFVECALGEPTELEPVSARPWSTVWRCRSASGVTGFVKQNCPGQAHEARLVSTLAELAPSYVVPVLGADIGRDLLLTADAGPTLRSAGAAGDVATWCRIVAAGAQLQRVTAGAAPRLGLTVLAPADATMYVADAVGRLGALPEGDPRRMEAATARALEQLLPAVGDWSDEVEDLGLPLALVHNDLHDDNVVAGARGLRFFDFGDAVLADPLANLLIPLRVVAEQLGAGPGDERLWRVADAALEVWSDLAPMDDLRRTLPAALQLGRLARAESWRRCVAGMTAEERSTYGAYPAAWLGTLAEEEPPVRTPVPH